MILLQLLQQIKQSFIYISLTKNLVDHQTYHIKLCINIAKYSLSFDQIAFHVFVNFIIFEINKNASF